MTQVHRYSSLKPKRWYHQQTNLFQIIRNFMLQQDRLPTIGEIRNLCPYMTKKQAQRQLRGFRLHMGLKVGKYRPQVKERLKTGKRKPHPFYDSDRWRALRWDVLKRDGAVCAVCGGSKKTGKVLQVDHIKPRSLRPDLEWDPANLQVLCQDCNLGKSNRDSTDWR